MPTTCHAHRHRAPQPLRTADDARQALELATDHGRIAVEIVACLDSDRLPLTMFIFDTRIGGMDDLEMALETLIGAAVKSESPLAAVFLGSSRPGIERGPTPDDEQRWARMAVACEEVGIDLLDWFILSAGAVCSVAEGLRPGPGW